MSAPEEHACPRCHGLREITVPQDSPPGYLWQPCPVCLPFMRPTGQSQVLPRRWRVVGEDYKVKGQT